jgi:hypothetical protein
MRSLLNSASRFLLATSLAACSGCDGGSTECGPAGELDDDIAVAGGDVALAYGNLEAGLNNDCPAEGQIPGEGITSLTIAGTQVGGTGFFTLCVERPDLLNGAQALGPDELGNPVRIVDVSGEANGCTVRFDDTVQPAGTATGSGVCADETGAAGGNEAGFALELDGEITLERTCGATVDSVIVTLSGRVVVAAQ